MRGWMDLFRGDSDLGGTQPIGLLSIEYEDPVVGVVPCAHEAPEFVYPGVFQTHALSAKFQPVRVQEKMGWNLERLLEEQRAQPHGAFGGGKDAIVSTLKKDAVQFDR